MALSSARQILKGFTKLFNKVIDKVGEIFGASFDVAPVQTAILEGLAGIFVVSNFLPIATKFAGVLTSVLGVKGTVILGAIALVTSGIADNLLQELINAVDSVDWLDLGQKVGQWIVDALINVEWLKVIGHAAELVAKIGLAILELIGGALAGIATELGKKVADWFSENYDFSITKAFFGNMAGELDGVMTEVDVFFSQLRQKFDEWMLDMKQNNKFFDSITDFFGLTDENLKLDITAQITKQEDLRERHQRYLDELGQVNEAVDNTGGNTMIDAAAAIDEVDNKEGYKPKIPVTAEIDSSSFLGSVATGALSVTATLKAQADSTWNTLFGSDGKGGSYGNAKDKTAEATLQGKEGSNFAKVGTYAAAKTKTVTATMKGSMGSLFGKIGTYNNAKTKTVTATMKGSMGNLFGKIGTYNSATTKTVKATMKGEKGNKYYIIDDYFDVKDKSVKVKINYSENTSKHRELFGGYNGGVFKNGDWKPITSFAPGGYAFGGQIFRARENGNPELVGTLRGSTAVMNNNQIVDSVANGVARSISNIRFEMSGFRPPEIDMNALGNMIEYAVASAMANNSQPVEIYTTIKTQNDEVLARAVQRGNRNINYRQTAVGVS